MTIKLTEGRLRQIIREEVERMVETSAYDRWKTTPDDELGAMKRGAYAPKPVTGAGGAVREPTRFRGPEDGLTPEQKKFGRA